MQLANGYSWSIILMIAMPVHSPWALERWMIARMPSNARLYPSCEKNPEFEPIETVKVAKRKENPRETEFPLSLFFLLATAKHLGSSPLNSIGACR